jgi:hypothetical protein
MFPDLKGLAELCPTRVAATDRTPLTATLITLNAGGP